MNDDLFIYKYAKIFHLVNVKTVLARENWDDCDFDVKYAKYIQDYIAIKSVLNGKNDDKIEEALRRVRDKRVEEIYDYIFLKFIDGLRAYKKVTDKKYDELKIRLAPYRKIDDFDFSYLTEIRLIEEEFNSNR